MKSFWSGFKYKINEAVGSQRSRSRNKGDAVAVAVGQQQNVSQQEDDKGEVSLYALMLGMPCDEKEDVYLE